MILSSIISCIAFLCVGPTSMLNFPDSLILMGIGQALVGVTFAMQMIPGLPEMVEGALVHYPRHEREVNNMSAGIFNSFIGLG